MTAGTKWKWGSLGQGEFLTLDVFSPVWERESDEPTLGESELIICI